MIELVALAEVPQEVGGIPTKQLLYYVGGGCLGLALIMLGFKLAFGKKKAPKKTKSTLVEDLGEYPEPPPLAGDRQLTVSGVPMRLRLVVIAPAGNAMEISKEQIPAVLNKVIPGSADMLEADRPRRRIWPAQPSVRGFVPVFTKNVRLPDDEDADRWMLVCGTARIGKVQVCLGMALLADDSSPEELVEMTPEDWKRMFRIERV